MEVSRELRAMRSMAWERAKGELKSMLHTYYSEGAEVGMAKFKEFDNAVDAFFHMVEDNALQE